MFLNKIYFNLNELKVLFYELLFHKNSLFQVFTIYRSCFIDSISNLWTGPPIIFRSCF